MNLKPKSSGSFFFESKFIGWSALYLLSAVVDEQKLAARYSTLGQNITLINMTSSKLFQKVIIPVGYNIIQKVCVSIKFVKRFLVS